jgi:predicted metal-dependent peptidase
MKTHTLPLEKRLAKARTSLILEQPFIGTLALNMEIRISERFPTAATNGKWIEFNPKFCEDLCDEQLKFLMAHEVFHPMFEHNYRLHGRNPKKWNMAGDYVINQILTDEKIGKFIEGGLLDKSIYTNGKGTTDGIYDYLPEPPPGGGGGGQGNDPGGIPGTGDDVVQADGSQAEVAQAQAEMKVQVAQAAQAAKMMGKLSAGMERLVSGVLQPKVDWREVLRRFVQKQKNETRTWARPNRRMAALGLHMPSISGETLGEITFAIDCSGSIGQKELDEFAAEIRFVWEDMMPFKLHVVYFDSEVCHYDKFERGDDVVVKPHGGGGTAFSPIFRYQEEHNINPVATIVLTDLYCSDYGPAPDYPVLWVVNTDQKDAPWGEVVPM